MKKCVIAAAVFCCAPVGLRADFSYEQSSKVTGGMMAGMMKVAGAFSKAAREPMKSTIMVKGDRMATVAGDRVSIVDLGSETMTEVDLKNKTYSTITFAEFQRAMQKLEQKMAQQKTSEPNAEVTFKADVKETGQTRVINGFNTRQTVMTLAMEGKDKQTSNTGQMNVTADMWLTPSVAGYEEVKNFYVRMAQKLAWGPGMGMMGRMMAQQQGASKGFAELYKQAAKLDGIPVLQITRIGGVATGQMSEADAAALQQAQQQQQQQPAPDVRDAAAQAAGQSAANRVGGKLGGLAGGLGGFGGFGRKKKQQQEEQTAQTTPPAAAPQTATSSGGGTTQGTVSGVLMELTTETTSFSQSVDATKFEVPAGFKKVEHDMEKALR